MDNRHTRLATTVLAAALAAAASLLIKVTTPLKSDFQMKYGSSLDISVNTDQYESDVIIIPGKACTYDPYIKNSGDYDAYVFLEVTLPDQTFHLGAINDGWYLMKAEGNTTIYAYGTSSSMTVLGKSAGSDKDTRTPCLTKELTIESDTDLPENTYTVEAKGYAIQQKGLDKSTPQNVWDIIQEQLKKEDAS